MRHMNYVNHAMFYLYDALYVLQGNLVTEKKLHGFRENQKSPLRRCCKQEKIMLRELPEKNNQNQAKRP